MDRSTQGNLQHERPSLVFSGTSFTWSGEFLHHSYDSEKAMPDTATSASK